MGRKAKRTSHRPSAPWKPSHIGRESASTYRLVSSEISHAVEQILSDSPTYPFTSQPATNSTVAPPPLFPLPTRSQPTGLSTDAPQHGLDHEVECSRSCHYPIGSSSGVSAFGTNGSRTISNTGSSKGEETLASEIEKLNLGIENGNALPLSSFDSRISPPPSSLFYATQSPLFGRKTLTSSLFGAIPQLSPFDSETPTSSSPFGAPRPTLFGHDVIPQQSLFQSKVPYSSIFGRPSLFASKVPTSLLFDFNRPPFVGKRDPPTASPFAPRLTPSNAPGPSQPPDSTTSSRRIFPPEPAVRYSTVTSGHGTFPPVASTIISWPGFPPVSVNSGTNSISSRPTSIDISSRPRTSIFGLGTSSLTSDDDFASPGALAESLSRSTANFGSTSTSELAPINRSNVLQLPRRSSTSSTVISSGSAALTSMKTEKVAPTLLNLPLEMRETIYHFLFLDGRRPGAAITCAWPSHLPPSFISNILGSTADSGFRRSRAINPSQLVWSGESIDTNIFTVNKQLSDEASHYFYSRLHFRFNSAQIPLLLITPGITHHLRYLEIEDTESGKRRWKVLDMIDRLAAWPNLRKVFLGINMLDYSTVLSTTYDFNERPFKRWRAEVNILNERIDTLTSGEIILPYDFPPDKEVEYYKCLTELEELVERRPNYSFFHFEKYDAVEGGEISVDPDEPGEWEYKLDGLEGMPTFSFVNFRKKLGYERLMEMLAKEEEARRVAQQKAAQEAARQAIRVAVRQATQQAVAQRAAQQASQQAAPDDMLPAIPGSFTNDTVLANPVSAAVVPGNTLSSQSTCSVM